MNTVLLLVTAALFGAAALYAQTHIPRFTAGVGKVAVTRGVLLAVGLAGGWVSAVLYGTDGLTRVLAFVSGLGAVHIPAAFILMIKTGRGAGQT